MFSKDIKSFLDNEISGIKEAGLYKDERIITTPQRGEISVVGGKKVLNFCANNYLGLSDNETIKNAAAASLEKWGYGMSSVRFICGTQEIHKELETKISNFLGMDDTILYTSCFDANGGLFETLMGAEDAIISDELNHASIIDGVRLSKSMRFRYKNNNMEDLEEQLREAKTKGARHILVVTDGVFSMDGYIANLKGICDLAEKYEAMVMVDDSHAVGFMGDKGRGTHEFCDVMGRVDIITGTLGKALGGASGGYTSARKEIVDLLRQRSRPYLFSNSVAPSITAASIAVLDLLETSSEQRERLKENTAIFRKGMKEAGFDILEGTHPIAPVMLYDAKIAQEMSKRLLEKGIYVVGFFFPVVPKEKARIRVQMSAAHSKDEVLHAIEMFKEVKKDMNL